MGEWVSLFSGGKDSSWALCRALERGLDVSRLLTVHPEGDSYMYHVPETRLAGLAAESVGIEHLSVEAGDLDAAAATDAGAQGDRELEPLRVALADLAAERELAGVVAGAVESEFQTGRLRGLCADLGLDLYAPLWGEPPRELAAAMLDAGFEIRIVAVAAAGLDGSWLGRRYDEAALADLDTLGERHGVHPLGEGGEFETLVTDGPHMARPLRIEYETEFDGRRGRIHVTDARLGPREDAA
jgi:diphthine-ammonia ligase